MNDLLENIYDVLFHPAAGLRKIAGRKFIGQAFAVFLLSEIIPAGTIYFGLETSGLVKALPLLIIIQVIGSLALWFTAAAVWHLITEFSGGGGSAAGLFTALGFANGPRIFLAPLWVLAAIAPLAANSLLLVIFSIVIALWSFILDVIAIRETYGLSTLRSAAIFLAPVMAVSMVLLGLILLAGAVVIHWPAGLLRL